MSSRARVYALVAAAVVGAAAIAAGVAWTGRGEEPAARAGDGSREGAPPLVLDVVVDDPDEAAALEKAIRLYDQGQRSAALAAFEEVLRRDPESLDAAVGAALAAWPNGTMAGLRELEQAHPASGLVKLHLGLGLYWQGKDAAAEARWREAEQVEPDSPAAIRAESLLHPEMPAGRPFFFLDRALPKDIAGLPPLKGLAALERRAEQGGDASAWIDYGAVLQRAGRPVSAQAAFDRALTLAPDDVEAQVADAVGRFDKDDPSQAFSRLGPLSRDHPDEPVVRFHLGLLLLWLGDVEGAREHLEAARAAGPSTVYGREATNLLDRLAEAETGEATR